MLLRHPGYCLGYRITSRGRRICYITETNPTRTMRVTIALRGAEVISCGARTCCTDTTYRDHEYPSKVDWGHSCVSQVADPRRAPRKRLHLFHHDPDQTDDTST